MREASVSDGANSLNRSVAACVASILEVDVASVPCPSADHPDAWTVWRNWLGQRRLGLVPIADPASFSWPGPWIAVLPGPESGDPRGAVAFGAPPGIAWSPLPTGAFEHVRQGFVIAPLDIAHVGPERPAPATPGTVTAILVAPEAEAAMVRVEDAHAEAGRGLAGDRYYAGAGTFSNPHAQGHDLTLVEQEVIDDLGGVLPGYRAEDTRRNVVTKGIRLNDLVGWRFRVGEVECVGRRLCEPCAHLDRISVSGSLRPLVHRGGLRADFVTSGRVAVGDPVEPIERL
ncbi:MAG TPA: MOSC domain-containing protein [Thermoleophilaceae bacterium]|nr:MOSC domain-containing protein [Thermoleophilaceae bacterium]